MHHRIGILLYKPVSLQLRPDGPDGLRSNLHAAVGEHKGGISPAAEVERFAVHMHPVVH